jgi:large subunit ribosomal protein L24
MAAKIKKGDTVIVRTGKDKGKTGEVLKVLVAEQRVLVQGINVAKRHEKPSMKSTGGVTQKELSIHVSNVGLVDPKDGKATRVGFKLLDDGKKVRVAKRSGEVVNA